MRLSEWNENRNPFIVRSRGVKGHHGIPQGYPTLKAAQDAMDKWWASNPDVPLKDIPKYAHIEHQPIMGGLETVIDYTPRKPTASAGQSPFAASPQAPSSPQKIKCPKCGHGFMPG